MVGVADYHDCPAERSTTSQQPWEKKNLQGDDRYEIAWCLYSMNQKCCLHGEHSLKWYWMQDFYKARVQKNVPRPEFMGNK